jgi:hypothetical protein
LALQADKLATGVAPLFEPVGVNKTREVVVGILENGLQEGVVVRHRISRAISSGFGPQLATKQDVRTVSVLEKRHFTFQSNHRITRSLERSEPLALCLPGW